MRQAFKHRQTIYITDPHFPKHRSGEFTGWLTEGSELAIAYVEVFVKSSRKQGHLETICVSEEYLSTIPPVNINH